MKLSTFMTIVAVIAFIFGLAFIFAPAQTMALYGVGLNPAGQWIGRYLGSAFIGIAVLNWAAKKYEQNETMRAILLGDFIVSITGLIVAVLDKILGAGNALVWLTVVIYFCFSVGFGYFEFMKPASA